MTNREKFAAAYDVKLREYVRKDPEEYAYPESEVPRVVAKMIPALAAGEANIGPATKAAARACGIKPTIGAIKTYLST